MDYVRLPLLDEMHGQFNMNLSDVILLTSHHILEGNYSLLNYLFGKGLLSSNVYCISKAYSTDTNVLRKYSTAGINFSGDETIEEVSMDYLSLYTHRVSNFLLSLKGIFEKSSRIIIWDDGGILIEFMAKNYEYLSSKITAIEHTSSGYERVKNLSLFPIINIARNNIKLEKESVYIAEACYKSIIHEAQKLGLLIKKCLVIGNGAIGHSIGDLLSSYATEVKYFDIKESLSDITDLTNLSDFDCIIGATGKPLVDDLAFFSRSKVGTLFCSTSSWDYEFNANLVRGSMGSPKNIHSNLEINGRFLLNNGFPINFTGNGELEGTLNMQITRGLIFGAFWQLCNKSNNNGIIELSSEITSFLNSKY